MRKLFTTALIFAFAVAAFAQAAPEAATEATEVAETVVQAVNNSFFSGKYLAHLSIAIAALGCGVGMGKAVASASEAIARNPQAAGAIRLTMIIGLAMIEALTIYAVVAAFAIQ